MIQLTSKQAEALQLYWQEGFKQKEVARMLGITQQSVSARLKNVKKKLKNMEDENGKIK